MKYILMVSILVACISCAGITAPPQEFIGLWEYPGTLVWVQIDPDGEAFQCRINQESKVLSARGHWDGKKIRWQNGWKNDRVTRIKDTLYLDGVFGKYGYEPASGPMIPKCQNPLG